ncbi:hypothetical protein [Salibacterium sp. K-3]
MDVSKKAVIEDAVSLGDFSPEVAENLQQQLTREIDRYKETGKLPGSDQKSGKN